MLNSIGEKSESCHNQFSDLLVKRPGTNLGRIATNSHYLELITKDNQLHGNSRNWGDIESDQQGFVVDYLLQQGVRENLSMDQNAFLLATARLESGFNPDAAAQSTSASGIGQLINATASSYGLNDQTRFDLAKNSAAMIKYLKTGFNFVQKNDLELCYAYALYHDGPKLNAGGYRICEEKVLPYFRKFRTWLLECSFMN